MRDDVAVDQEADSSEPLKGAAVTCEGASAGEDAPAGEAPEIGEPAVRGEVVVRVVVGVIVLASGRWEAAQDGPCPQPASFRRGDATGRAGLHAE